MAVPVPPGKQQVLLAVLLLSAGRPVPVDELVEVLWDSRLPPSARAGLHNHVMRLRKSLASTGTSRITTQPTGYLISVEPGELDVDQLASSLAAARGPHASAHGRTRPRCSGRHYRCGAVSRYPVFRPTCWWCGSCRG